MPDTVRIALVAVGGYGGHYLKALLSPPDGQDIRFVGAVDPVAAARAPDAVRQLEDRGIPLYPDLEGFFADHAADLVVIAAPHHVHCPAALAALAHGASVLCEKPVAATVQDARRMADAARRAGKFVAVGFQWSYAAGVQALKRDILAGRLGRPVQLKTLCLWPRDESYYGRNAWAGTKQAPDGAWVLDSPVNNATAHYLHNMLYVLGPTREASATPVDVRAELYRANPITNFDTGTLRIHTDAGAEVLFYSTHACAARIGPVASYRFERGVVHFDRYGSAPAPRFVARFADGTVEAYPSPAGDDLRKLWDCVAAVRTGAPVACDATAASAHLLCVNGAHDSMPDVTPFPDSLITLRGEPPHRIRAVRGLEDALIQCYDQAILPSEHGDLAWSTPGRTIDLTSYDAFPTASHLQR